MPITYTDITYIQNGQAINAANLNAPSVDLASRTVEVKRDADQSRFSEVHTNDSEVVLVSSSPEESSIVVRTQLKEDGSADSNLVKYYLPEFNNIKFSIYSKAVHGGRYVIDGADVGSLFSDSIDANNNVLSTALTVPGDGIYAKIPLRHTGEAESLTNYPDLVYPKTKAQSLGAGYLSIAGSAQLVKLPELVLMDFLSAQVGEDVSTFTSRLEVQFADIDSISVGEGGALQILDSNGDSLTLKVTGTQEGADCIVTHLLERTDGEPGFIAKFSRASAPIYIEHNTRIPATSIGVSLFRDSVELATSLVPISGGSYSGYFILPELLDPNYSYIPLVRLTENSLLVGDKSIPLGIRQLPNGETVNKHGDPIYGVPPEFSAEETASYSINILTDSRVDQEYKGKHTIRGTSIVDSSVSPFIWLKVLIDETTSPELRLLKQNLQVGDKIRFLEVRVSVIEECVSDAGNTDTMNLSARIQTPNNGFLYLNTNGNEPILNLPPNSLELGNTLELLPDSQSTYTWTAQDSDSSTSIRFYSYVDEGVNGQNMVSGKLYLEADLIVL